MQPLRATAVPQFHWAFAQRSTEAKDWQKTVTCKFVSCLNPCVSDCLKEKTVLHSQWDKRKKQLDDGWPESVEEQSLLLLVWRHYITSSTAQGGGGSFKNRKPIGEVGCRESRMAERSHWWIERCLISLTLSLSLSLPIYLPTYLFSMYLSSDRSIYLSLSFICLSV